MLRRIICINLSISFFLLIFIDVLMGEWFRPKPYVAKIPNAVFNQKLKYKLPEKQWKKWAREDKVIYTRDANGYRGWQSKSNNQKFILAIGGSTTDERYVSDDETYTELLEDILLKKGFSDIDVINAGVDGQSTFGHLFSLIEWHEKIFSTYKDDTELVLFYIGVIDRLLFELGSNDFVNQSKFKRMRMLHNHLKLNSFIYKKLVILKDVYSKKIVNDKSEITYIAQGWGPRKWSFGENNKLEEYPPKINKQEIIKYKNLFKKLVQRADDFFSESEIVFIQQFIPGCRFKHRDNIKNRMHTQSGFFKDYCSELQLVFDIQKEVIDDFNLKKNKKIHIFPMYKDVIIEDELFYDYIHTIPKGSRKIAEYIAEKVEPLLEK